MRLLILVLFYALWVTSVEANVEKRIFVTSSASDSVAWLEYRDSLLDLGIQVLTPQEPNLKYKIHAAFPDSPSLNGPKQAWFLLEDLEPESRYEIRASFGAMRPCDLNQTVFQLGDVLANSNLKARLEEYLHAKSDTPLNRATKGPSRASVQPVLYHIVPIANYFTTESNLMRDGHAIDFDITLDPYLWGIFPASLVSTAFFITLLALTSFLLATSCWTALQYASKLGNNAKGGKRDTTQCKDD